MYTQFSLRKNLSSAKPAAPNRLSSTVLTSPVHSVLNEYLTASYLVIQLK